MKKLLLSITMLSVMASAAFAASVQMDVAASFVDPFEVGAVEGANLGTIHPKAGSEKIVLDCSALDSVASGTETTAVSAANVKRNAVKVRRNGVEETGTGAAAGYVILKSAVENLAVSVSLAAPVNLDFEFSSSPTPIPVSGVSASGLPAAWGTGTKKFAPLYIGPILDVPANLTPGSYKGTMDITIEAL